MQLGMVVLVPGRGARRAGRVGAATALGAATAARNRGGAHGPQAVDPTQSIGLSGGRGRARGDHSFKKCVLEVAGEGEVAHVPHANLTELPQLQFIRERKPG